MKVNSARRNGALGGTDGIDIECCRHLPSGSDLHLSRRQIMTRAAPGAAASARRRMP
jgi:hypothetical protein